MNKPKRLILIQPDDWHLHVRDNLIMQQVIQHTQQTFARAIIMPNLKPAVTQVESAKQYRSRILKALPPGSSFNPLMTLYLTQNMVKKDLQQLKNSEHVVAVKYYPAGATTHSDAGVTNIKDAYRHFEIMQALDIPLLIHGESIDPSVDIFDREAVFLERHLADIVKQFPALRIVLEHVTTEDGVTFVESCDHHVAATITAHHLLINRNSLFKGGIRPHHYCLPVLKRESHRQALLKAATSGSTKFFLGTDSAPHLRQDKESACGCAGIYTAYNAMALYAEAFESANALSKLEQFASFNGADFYQLPRNKSQLTLEASATEIPESFKLDNDELIPFRAGQTSKWQVVKTEQNE